MPTVSCNQTSADVARRVVYFPGSTVGNFASAEAARLLRGVAEVCGPGGSLLIGVDLKKDPALLNAAYNDAAGVTAAFNVNLLARMNRELGSDFDLPAFAHRAFYNAGCGRVEMHLESLRAQTVRLAGQPISFTAGETIHTENSHKYSVGEFAAIAEAAGFRRNGSVDGRRTDVQRSTVRRGVMAGHIDRCGQRRFAEAFARERFCEASLTELVSHAKSAAPVGQRSCGTYPTSFSVGARSYRSRCVGRLVTNTASNPGHAGASTAATKNRPASPGLRNTSWYM